MQILLNDNYKSILVNCQLTAASELSICTIKTRRC